MIEWHTFFLSKLQNWITFLQSLDRVAMGKCKKYKVFSWKPFILLNEQRIENGKINLSPISSLSITYLAEPFQYSSCGCGRRLPGLTHRYNNSPAPGLELSTKVREVSTVPGEGQLEKLQAAKAAWPVCLSLLSLAGSFLVNILYSLTGHYLALLGLTGPFWALLGPTGPY